MSLGVISDNFAFSITCISVVWYNNTSLMSTFCNDHSMSWILSVTCGGWVIWAGVEVLLSFVPAFHTTMTSWWAWWRLKSSASRLFTQPFIQAQIKENIKAPLHRNLCGEFTGDRWIPRTKGQEREKCFKLMTSPYMYMPLLRFVSHQLSFYMLLVIINVFLLVNVIYRQSTVKKWFG